jgi:hypothetical protein
MYTPGARPVVINGKELKDEWHAPSSSWRGFGIDWQWNVLHLTCKRKVYWLVLSVRCSYEDWHLFGNVIANFFLRVIDRRNLCMARLSSAGDSFPFAMQPKLTRWWTVERKNTMRIVNWARISLDRCFADAHTIYMSHSKLMQEIVYLQRTST